MVYTEPRFTKDLDIWVEPTPDNASRVFRALALFGAPLAGIHEDEFAKPEIIYQLGVAPSRIDVLTSITGVTFGEAWTRRFQAAFDDVPVAFISREDLIKNKAATARAVDLVDCERLRDIG